MRFLIDRVIREEGYYVYNFDGYNVKGLKGQIMTFQESRKTKNMNKLDITFLIFKQ
jgi:hypothetical protein